MSGIFPDIDSSDPDGFLCWSPDLHWQMIVEAYSQGIFPWPQSENEILWFSPLSRGILEVADYHQSKSYQKWFRKNNHLYSVKKNHDFQSILEECAIQKRKGQSGTWITKKMKKAYLDLFDQGRVLCFSVYEGEELLGGIYAVDSINYFSAESMFYKRDNLSKLAFSYLVEEANMRSMTWIDLQMITPISESFGGKYVSRDEFLARI
ncbi:MAG: leucyl/phenylalanyl-tRNA--protein transferase [Bdellovibrionota bacterium]|nr:leucyl/phenylalanyl-tRNA--protein transferase [Bdellovibrionota bacterium]